MLLPASESKKLRIALLGIYHESNTFVNRPTTIEDFKNGRWLKGQRIIEEYKNAFHELGGAIEVFSENGVEIIPVFYAETTPGGTITADAYQLLTEELFNELEKHLPVDACFAAPHGAAVSQNYQDMDGSWLAELRKKLGTGIPVAGTLDPHANVSLLMTDSTNGLFPYSTNPHIDQRETGKKAARFLLDILNGRAISTQRLLQVPLAISIDKQHTEAEPCKSLYAFTKSLEEKEGILNVNIVLGFPYADVEDMGTSAIIISSNVKAEEEAVKLLKNYFDQHKDQFNCERTAVSTQLAQINTLQKPVLLLDMGDNVGAGTEGNSTWLLEELEKTAWKSFFCIYDPEAASAAVSNAINKKFHLKFGTNPNTGSPFHTAVTLLSVHDGRFIEQEPRHGGQKNYDMGKTAVIVTEKGNVVLLHSRRIPPFSLKQLTSCGINPEDFEVITAKGANAPIAAYQPVCRSVLRLNTPGPAQADMTRFNYRNRRKPLFPFEQEDI